MESAHRHAQMRFRLKIATTLAELGALEGAWRDLEAAGVRSACLRFDAACAMASAVEGVAEPLAILVESGRERALVALARHGDRIEALGGEIVDLVDPLATGPEALEALADAVREVVGSADLEVAPIRGDSPHLGFWRRLIAPSDRPGDVARAAVLRRIGYAHALLLTAGSAPACAEHSSSRKLVRALETRFPVRHRVVASADQAEAITWMMNGPPKTTRRAAREARLLDDRSAAYLEALAGSAPRESIVIRAIEARDELLAMVLGFEEGRAFTAHAYATSGALARYSPLLVCLYRTAAWLAERGISELNLGRIAAPAAWADVRRPLLALARGASIEEAPSSEARLDEAS
jgi:CelD/BcsL family acetyltransferase involved in cellulose biosynthesis